MDILPTKPGGPGAEAGPGRRPVLRACATLLGLMMAAGPGLAQAPDQGQVPDQGQAPAIAGEAEAPRPKSKPKPKPVPKPATKAVPAPVPTLATPAANLAPLTLPELIVVCDNGQAALYEGHGGVSVWVTRSGAITVDNPLRPLTPETTRVLQVVVGGKVATAFGPDLLALRRGGMPAALEATTGGPIRWDDLLTVLPDPLALVSEAGEPLARLDYRRCGEAPAVKAAPVAAKARTKAKAARAAGEAAAEPGVAPRVLQVPQGAIP